MKVLIIGAGGIGAALGEALLGRYPSVELIVTSRTALPASLLTFSDRATFYPLDSTDESQVKQLSETFDDVDWLINSTGMLCGDSLGQRMPEKSLNQIEEEFFLQNIRVNTLPTLWLAKHFALNLRSDRSRIFATLSARVGSIADNRLGGWHSYRVSKSALNMALKNIANEWRISLPNVCVAALHPGTVDTNLSKPFQKNVKPEKLFSRELAANQLLDVFQTLTPSNTGKFWAWDGTEIPW